MNADGAPAAYRATDAVGFSLQPVPDGVWENTVTVRSTRWARMYAPGELIARVSPTPLLLIVAKHDTTSLTDLALNAYQRALEPKRLVMTRGRALRPLPRRVPHGLDRCRRLVRDAPLTLAQVLVGPGCRATRVSHGCDPGPAQGRW